MRSTRCSAATCVEAKFVKSSACADGACVEAAYVKSSFSTSGACVEAADTGGTVLVRDSKDPDQEPLEFSREAWHAFLDAVQAGDIRP